MANSEFMALFGPDKFTANAFSEANSVKYRLVVRGTNTDSSFNSVEVSINGTDVILRNVQRSRGINMAVIDGTSLVLLEQKAFDMYADPAANGTAIKDYLAALPANRIVCFYSFDAIKSDDNFLATMRKIGSVAWPETRYFNIPTTPTSNKQRSSYCAVYSSTMKKICLENFVGGCGASLKDDTRSFVEVVFDEFSDIGVTGIPERMIDDTKTYNGNGYPFKVYGMWNIASGAFSLGDIYKYTADLYISQDARNAGAECYLYMFTRIAGGGWKSSTVIRTNGLAPDTWHSLTGYYTVPNDATIVDMGSNAYHFPSTTTVGLAQSRNVQITKVPREEVERTGVAIGVNGIRMQTLSEVDATGNENPITQLLSMSLSPAGVPREKKHNSYDFAELDYIVSDPVEYTSTNTAQYVVKEWSYKQTGEARATLSSVGMKAGDVIRVSSQMKRDANAITNNKGSYIVMQFWDENNVYVGASNPVNMRDVSTVPDVWTFYKDDGVVPAGAVTFDFGFYRYPNNTNIGSMSVKDVKLAIMR